MKTKQILLVSILFIGIIVIAFAQGRDWGGSGGPGPGGEGRPPMNMGDFVYRDMKPETVTKIKAILAPGEKIAKTHRDKAVSIEKDIQTAMLAKKVDIKKVNSLIAKAGSETVAARQAMTSCYIKVRPLVTEEQYKRIITPRIMLGGSHRRMGGQEGNPATKPAKK